MNMKGRADKGFAFQQASPPNILAVTRTSIIGFLEKWQKSSAKRGQSKDVISMFPVLHTIVHKHRSVEVENDTVFPLPTFHDIIMSARNY